MELNAASFRLYLGGTMNAKQRSLNVERLYVFISNIRPFLITFLTNVSDLVALKYLKDKKD